MTNLISVTLIYVYLSVRVNSSQGQADETHSHIVQPNDFGLSQGDRAHHHDHPPFHVHREFPPDFRHNPAFHRDGGFHYPGYAPRGPVGNSDRRRPSVFEEDAISGSSDESVEYINSSLKMIPIDFIRNINKYTVNDLLLNFIEGDLEQSRNTPFVANRFAGEEERSAATIPKAAGCIPEARTIKLVSSDDPSVLYIPQCTRIEQCGGCCSHPLLSCQPNQTETLSYQVLKTQYTGAKKLKLLGKEIALVEKHISCKCDCKVKEEHCNKYQEYRKSECRCACTNTDEEKKCYKNNAKKLWNPELCACQCRDVFQCSSGYAFDQHECRCVSAPLRRRNAASTDNLPRIVSEESNDSQIIVGEDQGQDVVC